jgi:aminocarboxymuconate-semialdehyde decarboxylase
MILFKPQQRANLKKTLSVLSMRKRIPTKKGGIMIIDFEHHFTPYKIWKSRGGKPGQTIRIFTEDNKVRNSLTDTAHDIQLHLKNMDIAGIDMAVLSCNIQNLEEAKLYNDECAKLMHDYPQRFIPFANTMPLRGQAALDELDRAVKHLGLRGVTIGSQIEGEPVDSPRLWPFYEKVSELDIPIFIHVTWAAEGFDACKAPYELNRTIVREFDLAQSTARLCLGGVLEDFPNLNVIVAHFGGGISSVKERLDRYLRYWGEKFWQGKPLISAPYLDRFNEHFNKLFFNLAGREIGINSIECALTNIRPERLLFATDYPFNFTDNPEEMKTYIDEIKKLDMDKEQIENILGENGKKLLGL